MVDKNNFQNESELIGIDNLIEKEKVIQKSLKEKLDESRERMKSFLFTKKSLGGTDEDFSNKTIPELLEILLRKYGAQHVNKLKLLLESEFGRQAGKQTISGTLIRYVNKDKIFRRAGRNIFDLKNRKQEKNS